MIYHVGNYAFILARGGSKRVPLKNIKSFNGKPMLSYAINSAKESQIFDRIIVSTDSQLIADVAVKYGAEIPRLRKSNLAEDSTPTIDVLVDEIESINLNDSDSVCCIYGTNPFLTPELLIKGYDLLREKNTFEFNYISTITDYSFPPQRGLKKINNQIYEMVNKENLMKRSQELETYFHECAQFWWAYARTWLDRTPMQEKLLGIHLPRWAQQDIDTLDDWQEAEYKYFALKNFKRLN